VSATETAPPAPAAGGEWFFRALCALLFLAPWIVLPGDFQAAHRPQTAFIQIGALALLVAALAGPVRQRRLAMLATPFDAPVLALLAWSGLSLLWAVNRYEGLLTWMHWSACALLFWLAAAALRDESDARRILQAVFTTGAMLSVLGLVQQAVGLALLPPAEPSATLMHKDVAAVFVVMTAPLGPTLLLHRPRSKLLIPYVAATAVMVSFVVVSFTRSAWLALATQAALFTLLLARDRDLRVRWPAPKRVMAIALGLAILVAAGVTFAALGRRRLAEGLPQGDVGYRRMVWLNTLAMARDAPLLGVGLANHAVVYPAHAGSAAPDGVFAVRWPLDSAHSDYLQVLAELGLVGLGIVAWLWLAVWRTLRRLWLREAAADRRALVLGVALALAGLAVEAAFSFPLRQALPPLLLMIYLGVLAALVTRFGWDARAWRLFDARSGGRRIVPVAAAAGACALLAATAWSHLRWLTADRHVLRMAQAEARRDWASALAEAEAAHRLDGGRRQPLFVMAEAHLAAGRTQQAVPPLRELLATRPYDARARYGLGKAFEQQGRQAEALEEYRLALSLDPTDPDAPRVRELLAQPKPTR
jgi:O-antigen ligase